MSSGNTIGKEELSPLWSTMVVGGPGRITTSTGTFFLRTKDSWENLFLTSRMFVGSIFISQPKSVCH